MSARNHTPGPWTFDGQPDNIIVWSGPNNRVCFMTSNGPAEANAHLIAAAPDLLKALKYARRFLRGADHDVDFVDAAIAKAEGRSESLPLSTEGEEGL